MDRYGKVSVQVWVLRDLRVVDDTHFIPPIDHDGTNVFMAWPNEDEARQGLAYQLYQGYLEEGDVEVYRLY